MIRLGYVKGNRMTNVKSSNIKLKERSMRILTAETNLDEPAAEKLMSEAGDDLRVALVMFRANANRQVAEKVLKETDFIVEKSVKLIK